MCYSFLEFLYARRIVAHFAVAAVALLHSCSGCSLLESPLPSSALPSGTVFDPWAQSASNHIFSSDSVEESKSSTVGGASSAKQLVGDADGSQVVKCVDETQSNSLAGMRLPLIFQPDSVTVSSEDLVTPTAEPSQGEMKQSSFSTQYDAGNATIIAAPSLDNRNQPLVSPDILSLPEIQITEGPRDISIGTLWKRISSDHRNFYSPASLLSLTADFGIGAIIANTSLDQTIQDYYQQKIKDSATDEFFESLHHTKMFGEGLYPIALYTGAMALGTWADEGALFGTTGQWGERTLRSILVGAPPMLLMQRVTGGSRPDETTHGPGWAFWNDNNGVSGHAYMGAVAFITAAQMTDRPWLKGGFYVASALTALSRVNDNAHYPSQVFLGWSMAFLAVSAVSDTEIADTRFRIVPLPIENGSGLGIEFQY